MRVLFYFIFRLIIFMPSVSYGSNTFTSPTDIMLPPSPLEYVMYYGLTALLPAICIIFGVLKFRKFRKESGSISRLAVGIIVLGIAVLLFHPIFLIHGMIIESDWYELPELIPIELNPVQSLLEND